MENIADKSDSTAGSTGELTASEYNNHKNELQGAVERSGQTLSAAILLQLSKALFINGTSAATVNDGGSGNSILLSPLTGSSGLVVPDNYAELDGAVLIFDKITENTATAVTVNFGQTGTELGAKTLVRPDGTAPQINDVIGVCTIRWDNTADNWILLSNGSGMFNDTESSTGTFTPQFGMNHRIILDTTSATITTTLDDGAFDGQRINLHCIDAGTANAYYKGTGVYDGASATGTPLSPEYDIWLEWSETESRWLYEDVVTADHVSGDFEVEQKSKGGMELVEDTLITFSANITQTILSSFPVSFLTTRYYRNGSPDSAIGGDGINHYLATPLVGSCTMGYISNGGGSITGSSDLVQFFKGDF